MVDSGRKELTEPESITIFRPTVVTEEFIAETIWSRIKPPEYVKYIFKTDQFETATEITLDEIDDKGRTIIYKPPFNDSLKKGLVIVPTGYTECTFDEVFNDIDAFAPSCYDACDQEALLKLLTRVAVGSWFMDRFVSDPLYDISGSGKFAPIIPIRGPSQSGKNRLAFVLRLLAYRPYFQMSTYRIPSIFRPIDFWRGTMVLDEADFNNTNEKSELVHFLNCRATGTPISRQNSVDPNKTDVFDNFGLTILTQRRGFDDNATESRAIPFYSQTTSNKKIAVLETDDMLRQGLRLQNKLLYLRMKYYRQVTIDKTAGVSDISDHRLVASLLPLLALSKFNPTMKNTIIENAKAVEKAKIEEKANSMDGQLINYLWEKINDHLFEEHQSNLYYVLESIDVTESNGKEVSHREALTTTTLAEQFKWSTTSIRKALNSLGIAKKGLANNIRVDGKKVKVIFFEPELIEKRLREFVVEYGQEGVTIGALVTAGLSNSGGGSKQQTLDATPLGVKGVPDVPPVPKNSTSGVDLSAAKSTVWCFKQISPAELCDGASCGRAFAVEYVLTDPCGDVLRRCKRCFDSLKKTFVNAEWVQSEVV
ncbi:MAG: hypothetical protein LBH79_03105 [Nitrososphaerota archaeon]|jgi:hypothetical protein|nr:hypothetical protein [Nitrososphaerota archaeon]